MEEIELKVTNEVGQKGSNLQTFVVNIIHGKNWMVTIIVTHGPTANCQISSIGAFESIMQLDDNNVKIATKKVIEKCVLRKILLLDIHTSKMPKFERIFKDHIINKMNYISTNKSEMTVILLKTTDL